MLNKKAALFIMILMVIAGSGLMAAPTKAFTIFPTSAACTAAGGVMGDLNHDGRINDLDYDAIQEMIAGNVPTYICGDFDGDGTISPSDRSEMQTLINDVAGGLSVPTSELFDTSFYNPYRIPACQMIYGDVNGDGVVNVLDNDIIKWMILDELPTSACGDSDSDGVVTSTDLSLIKIVSLGGVVPSFEKPVITLIGDTQITLEAGTPYIESGATAKDTQDGDPIGPVMIASAVNTSVVGSYIVTYDITDSDGNKAVTRQRQVNVVDTTVPVITLVGANPQTIARGVAYAELGATAADTYDGDISASIIPDTSAVNTAVAGSYIVTYNVADSSGNAAAQVTRTVNVIAPVISGGGGYSGVSDCQTVTYGEWSACDNDIQTRTVSEALPSGCQLTSAQTMALQQTCSALTVEEEGEVLGEKVIDDRELQLAQIFDDAHYIWPGDTDYLLAYMSSERNLALEQSMNSKYGSILGTSNVQLAVGGVETFNSVAVTNFLTYGTKTTLYLGAGERAGVLNSYKAAFGHLPKTEEDWRDAIKIGNGRWTTETSAEAEARAHSNFKLVYLRDADMANANDNAAVTTMAYGLRPLPRNLDSEAAAIKIFTKIFGYTPVMATAWDVVRAIAYSGATR